MNPAISTVQLCVQGIQAEMAGAGESAAALFRQAWEARADDYDACVAAHYVARHQSSAAESLWWNLAALRHADAAPAALVGGFYASFHLELGRSYEGIGDLALAARHYKLAVDATGPAGYGSAVRRGVEQAAG